MADTSSSLCLCTTRLLFAQAPTERAKYLLSSQCYFIDDAVRVPHTPVLEGRGEHHYNVLEASNVPIIRADIDVCRTRHLPLVEQIHLPARVERVGVHCSRH
jgi:hypothetical protein